MNGKTKKKKEGITHAYVHRLADVYLAGFAPAFTLSLCDSEYARNPPVPIASVVTKHIKKNRKHKSTLLKTKNINMTNKHSKKYVGEIKMFNGLYGFISYSEGEVFGF